MGIKLLHRQFGTPLIAFFLTASFFYLFLFLQKNAADYMNGAYSFDMVYLPAGVAFVAILIAGISAAVALFFVLVINYTINFPDSFMPLTMALVSFSLIVQLAVVKLYLYIIGVGKNLEKLKHLQLLGLALVFSVSHSLCHHLNLVTITGHQSGWAESLITVRTFLGIFCVLMVLWFLSKVIHYFDGRSDIKSL